MQNATCSRRDFLKTSGLLLTGLTLSACTAVTPSPMATEEEAVAPGAMTFAWWGSPFEKDTVVNMLDAFTAATGIPTEKHHLPFGDYMNSMQAMAAAGTLPDVFYLSTPFMVAWAQKAVIKDLTELHNTDPEADIEQIVEVNRFRIGARVYGTGAATEPYMMFYNRKLFDANNVEYPPATVEAAWSWEDFIEVAKQLTIDEKGHTAADVGFDAESIQTFGVDLPRWGGSWRVYSPGLWQNGSDVYSEDENTFFPDQDIAIEVLQKTADTYVQHKVAASPEFFGQVGMSSIQLMENDRLAMFLTGNWSLEALSHTSIDYGEAVVPIMGPDYVVWAPSEAIGINENTLDIDSAWQLYKWVVFGEGSLALSRTGLWQPQRVDLLTTEEGRAKWMTEGVHTPDHITAACLPSVHNARRMPLRLGHSEVEGRLLGPALGPVYTGEVSAQEALETVLPEINEFLRENPNWKPA